MNFAYCGNAKKRINNIYICILVAPLASSYLWDAVALHVTPDCTVAVLYQTL
jgi:hypothetical protein